MAKGKLFIAIPSTHTWEAKFGASLVSLCLYLASRPLPGFSEFEFMFFNKTGSILSAMRHSLVVRALEEGYTHLLFLDSDQTFPNDTFHRLASHNRQVVACNISTKEMESYPTARQYEEGNPSGKLVYTMPDSHGLEQVWRVGTGIMLLNLNLFKREAMEKAFETTGYFPQHYREYKNYQGEDWGFCEVLEAAGVKMYIDHDVSKEVGHLGIFEFKHDNVLRKKEYDEFLEQQRQEFLKEASKNDSIIVMK